MKKIKLAVLILSLIFISQSASAEDYAVNNESLDFMHNSNMDDVVNVDNLGDDNIFNDSSTKVIKTKGRFFKGWKFIKGKKKKEENEDKPVVIDYDYDTETEEIIPVVRETKSESENNDENNKNADVITSSNINVYCENMEYFDERKEIVGTGSPKVVFTDSNSVMNADKIIFNHDLNYIEGIGNVRITKSGNVMEGDYTKVDLNYGNAMIENPIVNNYMVKIIAKKGVATTDSLEAYDGVAQAKENFEKRV